MRRYMLMLLLLLCLSVPLSAQETGDNSPQIDTFAFEARWSPDGTMLGVGSLDGAWLFDLSDPDAEPRQFFPGQMVYVVAFDPLRPQFAVVPDEEDAPVQSVYVMDLETGDEVYHAPVPMADGESFNVPYELAYSPDGSQLVVLNTSQMHVLNADARGERVRRYVGTTSLPGDVYGWLSAIGFGAQGEIYVTDLGGWMHSFATVSNSANLAELGLAGAVNRIEPIPETSDLLLSHFGAVIRFNTDTNAQTVLNDPEFHPVNAIDLSPDGLTMAWGGDDEWWLVDLETGDTLMESTVDYTPDTWSERIYSINFSPDGTRVATLQTDGQLRVWDIETGESVLVTRFNNGVNQRWG